MRVHTIGNLRSGLPVAWKQAISETRVNAANLWCRLLCFCGYSSSLLAVCRSDFEQFIGSESSGSDVNVHAVSEHAWRMKYNVLIISAKVRLLHR